MMLELLLCWFGSVLGSEFEYEEFMSRPSYRQKISEICPGCSVDEVDHILEGSDGYLQNYLVSKFVKEFPEYFSVWRLFPINNSFDISSFGCWYPFNSSITPLLAVICVSSIRPFSLLDSVRNAQERCRFYMEHLAEVISEEDGVQKLRVLNEIIENIPPVFSNV